MTTMKRLWLALAASALLGLCLVPHALATEGGAKKAKPAAIGEAGIIGEWWTEQKDGRIRFYKYRDGTYRGVLAWSKRPRPDTENDNPKLRSRSVVGILLMWKLHYDEEGEFEDGYVYNPEDGNVYRFDAKVLGPDKLEIHGYLGISLFGQTQVWTRYR